MHNSDACRSPAHSLMMRLVRHDPRYDLFHRVNSVTVPVVNFCDWVTASMQFAVTSLYVYTE